jgi:hypothetical protein
MNEEGSSSAEGLSNRACVRPVLVKCDVSALDCNPSLVNLALKHNHTPGPIRYSFRAAVSHPSTHFRVLLLTL